MPPVLLLILFLSILIILALIHRWLQKGNTRKYYFEGMETNEEELEKQYMEDIPPPEYNEDIPPPEYNEYEDVNIPKKFIILNIPKTQI